MAIACIIMEYDTPDADFIKWSNIRHATIRIDRERAIWDCDAAPLVTVVASEAVTSAKQSGQGRVQKERRIIKVGEVKILRVGTQSCENNEK